MVCAGRFQFSVAVVWVLLSHARSCVHAALVCMRELSRCGWRCDGVLPGCARKNVAGGHSGLQCGGGQRGRHRVGVRGVALSAWHMTKQPWLIPFVCSTMNAHAAEVANLDASQHVETESGDGGRQQVGSVFMLAVSSCRCTCGLDTSQEQQVCSGCASR